jgi:hypothetical protein
VGNNSPGKKYSSVLFSSPPISTIIAIYCVFEKRPIGDVSGRLEVEREKKKLQGRAPPSSYNRSRFFFLILDQELDQLALCWHRRRATSRILQVEKGNSVPVSFYFGPHLSLSLLPLGVRKSTNKKEPDCYDFVMVSKLQGDPIERPLISEHRQQEYIEVALPA